MTVLGAVMNVVQDIVALLNQRNITIEDWPAVMALTFVMTGMIAMELSGDKGGPECVRETLLEVVDEIRDAVQEWTPGIDIQTQLAARFSDRLDDES
jgi:hypothetical protein